ncbi:MAG: integrase [Candidatus Hinthialibacteria bacterium]
MVEASHPGLPVMRQCELLGLAKSSFYYAAVPPDPFDDVLMRLLDEQYTRTPFYGVERMTCFLQSLGHAVGRDRVRRLLREMGLTAVYPKPRTSLPDAGHRVYPYLLRGLQIKAPNEVWSSDITYIRMRRGFVYLAAVMDWFSRYVVAWKVAISLEVAFCVEALEEALGVTRPGIHNSDQGSQYTSVEYTQLLQTAGVRISMDGRGRFLDNIFVERLWRTVKYEEVYLKDYSDVWEAERELGAYFAFYNRDRPHQSLGNRTPEEVWNRG